MLEAKTNPVFETINNINCLLELGKWTPASIDNLLLEANNKYIDPSARMYFIMQHFVGVKFAFESMSPIPQKGCVRVRLEYMDCVTYIYNMLALCKSKNFKDFVFNLYKIRYLSTDTYLIDNDPDTGNIFDFVFESLIKNGSNMGYLKDITEQVAGSAPLIDITVDLKRFPRPDYTDKDNMYVTPRFGEGTVTEKFISVDHLEDIKKSNLKTGDIVLLSEGPITKKNTISPVLISHLAIACIENDEIYFYHSTRHFYWRPNANSSTPPSFTGIFLDKDCKKEVIGTAHAGIFAGDETKTEHEGLIYFGLNQDVKRPLKDFASRLFKGVKFMRIL